jgi:hypothetical protein
MKVEKVKIMTTEEVADFKRKVYGKGSEKKQLSADYCAKNIKDLIKKHDEFHNVHIKEKYNKYKEYWESYNALVMDNNILFDEVKNNTKSHSCTCGAKLKYISNFNFVGCSDYRNESQKHININFKNISEYQSFEDFYYEFEFSNTYINDFKKHYKLDFLMSSIIYEFLFEVYGQKCYSNDLSYNNYQTGVNASKQSKKEELIVKSICLELFHIVKEQMHFSLVLNGKHCIRIPDLICSNKNKVYVFDVKKNNDVIDLDKLNLYQEIVKQHLANKNDKREVLSFHIVYDKNSTDDLKTRTLTINSISNYEF